MIKYTRGLLRILDRTFGSHQTEPESKLIADAQGYWSDTDSSNFSANSHWRGAGPFADDALWLELGRQHLDIVNRAVDWNSASTRPSVAVEWGCGGGMNAAQIAPQVDRYFGVDISDASLRECGEQLEKAGQSNFSPVLIPADTPEEALQHIAAGSVDLFLSVYVFELLPTPGYGVRVLEIAGQLLKPDATAVIQIRYNDGTAGQLSKNRRYTLHLAQMTTYGLEEFWKLCEQQGLSPQYLILVPEQAELREERYAYFVLRKA